MPEVGTRQRRLNQIRHTMYLSLGLALSAIIPVVVFGPERSMWVLLSVPLALSAGVLGLVNITRNNNDLRARLRAIDNGEIEDDEGVLYNSRAQTVRDSVRLGYDIPKEF